MAHAGNGLSSAGTMVKTSIEGARYDAKTKVHNVSGYLYRKSNKSISEHKYDERRYITPTVNQRDLAIQDDNRFAALVDFNAAIEHMAEATDNYVNSGAAADLDVASETTKIFTEKKAKILVALDNEEVIPVGRGDVDYNIPTESIGIMTNTNDMSIGNNEDKPVDFDRLKLRIDRKSINKVLIKKNWFKAYSKLLNHIRIKYFMRTRDTTTIHNMVSDARIWLIKNGHTCDNDLDYQILSASVMAGFVVTEEELEFRQLLKTKEVLDGVKHLNATMSGDLGYSWVPLAQRMDGIRNPLLSKVTLPSKPLI